MQKKFPIKHSEEEQMKKRFVKDRKDAEFTRMAEREFQKYKIEKLDVGSKLLDEYAREMMEREEAQDSEEELDEHTKQLKAEIEEKVNIAKSAVRKYTSIEEKKEDIEAEALFSQGKDPLAEHKVLAKMFGEDDSYFDKLERVGWNPKRDLMGSKGFSQTNSKMSDVKLEEYKASLHSPDLFKLPEDGDKRKNVEEFTDQEIKDFMEKSSPDEFDAEMAAVIHSRYQKIKRREKYRESGFKPAREHSDDESDMEIRLTKSQKQLETATKLQQNILDMEITKEEDQNYKQLVEKENVVDKIQPPSDYSPEKAPIISGENKKALVENYNEASLIEDPVMKRVYSQLEYLTESLDLTLQERKKWFYRLRREEKELEKQREIQAKSNAKKAMKKLVRKLKIPQLKQLDDIEEFYEREGEEKKDLPEHYESFQELEFYNDDMDLLRYHKRTKRNMQEILERYMIETDKRSVTSGMMQNHWVSITNIKLNKKCTLLHVFWDMATLDNNDSLPKDLPVQNPELFNKDWRQDRIATIQKNLVKGTGYFRSKLCQELGLRYAPELRFYHDNSEDVKEEFIENKGIESLTGVKYDPNNYEKYLRELEKFKEFSKLDLDHYIEIKEIGKEQGEWLKKLHEDEHLFESFKQDIKNRLAQKDETLRQMALKAEQRKIKKDRDESKLQKHEKKLIKQRKKVFKKEIEVMGEDFYEHMDEEMPKTMEEAQKQAEEFMEQYAPRIPKQEPIVDQLTGERLRPRTNYANKVGKKGRWRNKKQARKDKFWNDLDAM